LLKRRNGLRPFVAQRTQEIRQRPAVFWSPDSFKLVTYRMDTRNAGRLKGHLLIEHGDIDDNVHAVETMRLTDALIKANKNFEQLIVPNMYHGEGGNPYLIRRRWDYFVQYLLGVTPPPDFAIHEEREAPALRPR
jgi:Prolyl oligopeptidase family